MSTLHWNEERSEDSEGSLLKVCNVEDKTGAGLVRTILDSLKDEDLDVRNIRGQGYDGCTTIQGIYRGVQADTKAVVPQALYSHCESHCLNLVLVHSSKITPIRLAADLVGSICAFFSASTKRIRLLQEDVEINVPSSKNGRLKPLCATRWVESHHAFVVFEDLLVPIVHCLEQLQH